LELASERFEQAACSTADLKDAFATGQEFRDSIQDSLEIALARRAEGALTLRIITGDGLMGVLAGAHVPLSFHIEMAHVSYSNDRTGKVARAKLRT
jgi:hypothetical protein